MYCFALIRPNARLVLAVLILFSCNLLRGQKVDVSMSTGTVHVSIPVYTVKSGNAIVPLTLEYYGTGIKPAELESVVGTGWKLKAGGVITRELRDLPDDIKADQGSNSRMGWLYNTNATKINNFTIANDNNPATCSDETADLNYIATNFSDNSDLEPDIFDVEAPGLSCQLIYDQINGVFRTIPYQDLIISYTLNSGQNSISSFTITNDKGIIYTFSAPESVTQTSSSSNPSGIIYFKRAYSLYVYGIVFNQKWYLSQITDPNGNYITLGYINGYPALNFTTPTVEILGLANNNSALTNLYNVQSTYRPQFVNVISSYNKLTNLTTDVVNLNYTTTTNAAGTLLQAIYLNHSSRTLTCTYNKVPGRTRDYLVSFGESGCSANGLYYNSNLYQFNYSLVNFSTPNPSGLVDFALDGTGQDFWGYPNSGVDPNGPRLYVYPDNPSYPNLERYRFSAIPNYTGTSYTLNGEIKSVDTTNVTIGSLSGITYPSGGSTSFTYESNDYYDVSAATFSAGAVSQGGGLRVRQIVDYDGINTANNIIRNYTYKDPTTGISTGKPIALPSVAFTLPYTGTATGLDYWNYSTVRLSSSNSNQNESIVYGKVTMQQTGAGKTLYEYTTPATFWDSTAGTDWRPTMVNTGRSIVGGSCPGVGSVKNAKYIFPFPPNINYDFERELLDTVTTYNESSNLVSQSIYTYQRSYASAISITALKVDTNSTTKGYAKYQIFTTTSELLSTETKYINDLTNTTNDPTKRITSVNNYYYNGSNHKLPTEIQTTNTDGSIDRTYIKYVKDYTWSLPNFSPLNYLKGLNENIPVEKYYTVTRSGVENAFSGELTLFGAYLSGVSTPSNIYLPSQTLQFISSTGISNFPASYNNSGTFTYYSGYIPVANDTAYNYFGYVLSQDDNFKNVKSQMIDDNLLLPVSSILNANWNEVAYSNFDGSDARFGFSQTGCSINSTTCRTGTNSLTFPTTGLIQSTKVLRNNAKNYIFSAWINAASSGTLTISLYTNTSTLFGTATISFTSSGSGWKYYEQKINTNGLTPSFTIKVQTSTANNIDDILFYPESAEVTTYAYNPNNFLKTAETNTNGVSKYYGYDNFYRLQYVYDQDRNIVLKKTYASASTIASGLISASFTTNPASGISVTTPITFTGQTGSGACTPGTYYSYNFGDGTSTTPSLSGANSIHSYTTAGNYTVTFTVTNSIFGTKTYTQTITALMLPNVCQSGVWAYYGGHVYQMTCTGYPNDTTHSYFQVIGVTGLPPGHTLTYQWWIEYTATGTGCGSTSWTQISGATTSQCIRTFSRSTFCPYNIKCVVTDTNNGQVVTTSIMSVQNNGS